MVGHTAATARYRTFCLQTNWKHYGNKWSSQVRLIGSLLRIQRSGRLNWQRRVWELEMKNGTVESYKLFELWMEHYQSVKGHFESRGIPIEDRNKQ